MPMMARAGGAPRMEMMAMRAGPPPGAEFDAVAEAAPFEAEG